MPYEDKAFWMVSVKALVVERSRVLLLKRHGFAGLFWDAPGGTVDSPDDDFSATLARELDEEIGYAGQFSVGRLVGMQRWHLPESGYPPKLTLFFEISTHTVLAEPRLSEEHAGWHWVAAADLAELAEECPLEPELAAAVRTTLG
jgi:8-oxo-dGTP pyrophosphatase MutT (NUDIX family)